MCGISGIISQTPCSQEPLVGACNIMHHRGPDANSYWSSQDGYVHFGHIRLSIVDPDPRSTQPFQIDNGAYIIVFNGEIYNYKKLREELVTQGVNFRTTSDTEVLVFLYKLYGKKCLEMIEGMFAFAIYDTEKNEVFFARDFAGQKPLIYAETASGVYFASEIPGLFALSSDISREIDMDVLKMYLIENFSHIPPMLSFYKGIKKLPNASYMMVRDGKVVETGRYEKLVKHDEKDSGKEVDFLDNILDEMRPSDVGFASFLSGGIDSSYICSVLKKHETTPTEAYTLKIPGNDDDYKRSKYVSEKLGLIHHTIELENQDLLSSVDETVKNIGEPYFHITSVYADLILKEAKKQHRVFFTGAGGDECYYGYDNIQFLIMGAYFKIAPFLPHFLKKILDTLTHEKLTSVIYSTRETFKERSYQSNFQKISHYLKNSDMPQNAIERITSEMRDFVELKNYIDTSYMYGLFVENLHSLTLQGDAIGMKNSLEIRSLFLEKRVIKRSYSLPIWKKISCFRLREGKEILRKGLAKILGKDFVYAKKIGFGVHFNFRKYFKDTYFERIEATLQNLEKRDILISGASTSILQDFEKNYILIMKLYALEKLFEYYPDISTGHHS